MPIGKIVSGVMGALGAKKGSSSWEKKSFLTPEQEKLHKETLKGYSDLEYEGPGEYKSGQKADDLEGFKAKGTDELRSLQDEGNLSISGLDKLRSLRADAATRVNPDIEAIRKTGKNAWQGYDAHLEETTRGAREKLQQADIAARRGGMGGTALARLGSRNVLDYGRTVGGAAARAVEQSAMQRQQLALRAQGMAMQGGMQLEQLGLEGMRTAGGLEAQQNQMALQDLMQRRNISAGERQFGATHGLNVAQFSEQQAQNQNLWSQQNAQNKNRFALDRLAGMQAASTTHTFKNIKNVKKGSSGLGGALITAGGTALGAYLGGPQGAAMGAQLGQGLVGGMGYDDGGGSMGNAIASGANLYASAGGFQNAGPTTTGTTAPGTGYNAVVPPRAFNTHSMGYGTGAYGEFGDPTGSTSFSGIDPRIAMGGLDEPMGMNTMQHQSWRIGMGGARPMPHLYGYGPIYQP